jgi:hypothetical protein
MTNPQNRNTIEKVFQIIDNIALDEFGCKPWVGICSRYPRVMIDGVSFKVTRLVLERKLGRAIKPGFFALHTCDYQPCVNKDHLYEGTQNDNIQDIIKRHPRDLLNQYYQRGRDPTKRSHHRRYNVPEV